SAAGPGIQFVLLALIVGAVYATGGKVDARLAGGLPLLIPHGGELTKSFNVAYLIALLMEINLLWPIINLLPVLPLDGGQIALQVLVQQDPWGGTRRALWLSVIAGGVMAVFALLSMHDLFAVFLFGSLAASSYLTLQQMGGGHRPW